MNDPLDPSNHNTTGAAAPAASLAEAGPGSPPAGPQAAARPEPVSAVPAEAVASNHAASGMVASQADMDDDDDVPVLSEVVGQEGQLPQPSAQPAVAPDGLAAPAEGVAPQADGQMAESRADSATAAPSPVAASGAAAEAGPEPEIRARRTVRKRLKPGERRLQILQALAEMLEQPRGERVTTAALAARLSVSEAALYRHFASKAQMFEGLIEFIESTLFGLINHITRDEEDALAQVQQVVNLLLTFSERNPGMTRVLVGDALINEDERLQVRINQLIDRLELSLKQCFRTAVVQQTLPADTDAAARADLVLSYVLGRWMRYAKGGFRRMPTESVAAQIAGFIT